jgi:twinkle protein
MQQGHTVGYLALEESVVKTLRGLMGLELNKPAHYWDYKDGKLKETFMKVTGSNRLVLYDHFGSIQYEHLLSKIRYMVLSLGATHIFLDHLSIVISGLDETGSGNERKLIDICMTKIRSMVEELGVCVFLVSHLSRTREGTSHEEGGFTSLSSLRGSHSIGQLSDIVIGLERNQQEAGGGGHITTIRILKNRFSGECGVGTKLQYDPQTGRLHEWTGDADSVDDMADLPL